MFRAIGFFSLLENPSIPSDGSFESAFRFGHALGRFFHAVLEFFDFLPGFLLECIGEATGRVDGCCIKLSVQALQRPKQDLVEMDCFVEMPGRLSEMGKGIETL